MCGKELDGFELSRCVREEVAFVFQGAKYPRAKINPKEIIAVYHWDSVHSPEHGPFHLGLNYSNLLNAFVVT